MSRPRPGRSGRRAGRPCPSLIPARSSAALLTHASWPSRLGRNTGRSGTIRSRSSRRGTPPGKSASDQPPPSIHSQVRMRGGVGGDHLEVRVEAARLVEVALESLEPGGRRVHVRVAEAGDGPAPELDDARRGPTSGRTSRSPPTATIRPSRTASAGPVLAASAVKMRPPVRTRSAWVDMAECRARRPRGDAVAPTEPACDTMPRRISFSRHDDRPSAPCGICRRPGRLERGPGPRRRRRDRGRPGWSGAGGELLEGHVDHGVEQAVGEQVGCCSGRGRSRGSPARPAALRVRRDRSRG